MQAGTHTQPVGGWPISRRCVCCQHPRSPPLGDDIACMALLTPANHPLLACTLGCCAQRATPVPPHGQSELAHPSSFFLLMSVSSQLKSTPSHAPRSSDRALQAMPSLSDAPLPIPPCQHACMKSIHVNVPFDFLPLVSSPHTHVCHVCMLVAWLFESGLQRVTHGNGVESSVTQSPPLH